MSFFRNLFSAALRYRAAEEQRKLDELIQEQIEYENSLLYWHQVEPYYTQAYEALQELNRIANLAGTSDDYDRAVHRFEVKYKAFDSFIKDKRLAEFDLSELFKVFGLKEDYEWIVLGIPYPDHDKN